MAKQSFDVDGTHIDLTTSSKQVVVVAKFGFKYQGFGSKAKGVFKIVDDNFASWKIFDGKGHLLVSYGAFSDPKPTADVVAAVSAAVLDALGPDDFPIVFYPAFDFIIRVDDLASLVSRRKRPRPSARP